MTVTDLGYNLRDSLPSWASTAAGFGTTVFGDSKVLTLSTFGAVNVSAVADSALTAAMSASTVTESELVKSASERRFSV